jgi:putative cardiolipin synthase
MHRGDRSLVPRAAGSGGAVTATEIAPLRKPLDALASRVSLIDEAPTTLDLQYYETNSLASNSGTISNSGTNRQRKGVVQAGVELFELRPDAAVKPGWETAANADGYLGLHAKLYVLDGEKLFLGSANLDPRSKFINTEIGIQVDNSELARSVTAGIEALMAPDNSWRVEFDRDGHLTWSDALGKTRHQPARSVWQRTLDRILQVLPLDRFV